LIDGRIGIAVVAIYGPIVIDVAVRRIHAIDSD
jgi:hypothetical protein